MYWLIEHGYNCKKTALTIGWEEGWWGRVWEDRQQEQSKRALPHSTQGTINNSTQGINNTKRSWSYQTNLQKAEKERREEEDSGENKVVPSMQEKTWVRFTFFFPLTPFSRRTTSWHQGQTRTQESLGEKLENRLGITSIPYIDPAFKDFLSIYEIGLVPKLIWMIPTWISIDLDVLIFRKARLEVIFVSISKCFRPPSP